LEGTDWAEIFNLVRDWFERLWQAIRVRRTMIAVFGLGGVGKTTLGRLLSGEMTAFTGPPGYEESIGVERYNWPGGNVLLVVPPGQQHRRDTTWADVLDEVRRGSAFGVINVVCHGYASFDLPHKKHKLYSYPTMGLNRFLAAYTDASRAAEAEALREVVQGI